MTTRDTDTRELREDEEETDDQSRATEAASKVARFNENGTLSLALGGVLLLGALRSLPERTGRGVASGLAGAALLGLGIRQRRGEGDEQSAAEDVSSEAHAARAGYDDEEEAESPRGVDEDADVETRTDEGNVQFSEEQDIEAGKQPNIEDEAGVEDPRRSHDDEVEIDLSDASMADEASEATGPSPEQAQPASTEGTEPEPTPTEDASHLEADTPSGDDEPKPDADPGEATEEATSAESENVVDEITEDEDIDEEDREGIETEGGATVHTDTVESGEIDIDEEEVDADEETDEASDEER